VVGASASEIGGPIVSKILAIAGPSLVPPDAWRQKTETKPIAARTFVVLRRKVGDKIAKMLLLGISRLIGQNSKYFKGSTAYAIGAESGRVTANDRILTGASSATDTIQ